MKEICVKVTFHFEDGSDKAVDVQRVERAVRHGFPYALGGEIDVEEIEEFKGEVIPTPLASLRRQAALAAALNDACNLLSQGAPNVAPEAGGGDVRVHSWRELIAKGNGLIEGTPSARETKSFSRDEAYNAGHARGYVGGFSDALETAGKLAYEKGEWKDTPHNRRADILRIKRPTTTVPPTGGVVDQTRLNLAAPSKKAFNDGIDRAVQVLSIEAINPTGTPTLGHMIDAIRREKK